MRARTGLGLGLGAAASVVALVAGRAARAQRPAWHSVTVLGEPDAVRAGLGSGPLGRLRDLDVRIEPAPGDRGSEIHARYRHPVPPHAVRALRTALRDAKSLVETGDVIRVDPRPHGRRRDTPWGLVQDAIDRRAKGVGLL